MWTCTAAALLQNHTIDIGGSKKKKSVEENARVAWEREILHGFVSHTLGCLRIGSNV